MFKRFFSEKSWHRQNLAGIASIEFPERPEVKQSTGIIQIGLYNKPTYFLVDIEDLSNYPGVEVSKDELQNLYLGIQTGYFQNPKFRLVNTTSFVVANLLGLQSEYVTSSGEEPSQRVKRDFFVNRKIISFQFWTDSSPNGLVEKDKERFFNSFQIALDVSGVKQHTID